MAKLTVKIEIPELTGPQLAQAIAADRTRRRSWFSEVDGDKILIDDAYLECSKEDDSFYVFELVSVED